MPRVGVLASLRQPCDEDGEKESQMPQANTTQLSAGICLELRLAAVVGGLAVREAAAKRIAGILELVGAVAHVGQGDGGDDKQGFQRRRGAAVGSGFR
jgi:hypothetical protein